jgi:hypothetical protein
MEQCQICGTHKTKHRVYHAWKVNWEVIKQCLPESLLGLLKYNQLCDPCIEPLKKAIKEATTCEQY